MAIMKLKDFAFGCYTLMAHTWKEIEGCVLSVSVEPDDEKSAANEVKNLLAKNWSKREIESFLNHVHVSLALSNFSRKGSTFDDLKIVADVMVAIVEKKLRCLFPEREFVVKTTEEEDDIMITCYQQDADCS